MIQPITTVPREAVFLVVDMQNRFCDLNGSMAKGKLLYEQHNQIILAVRELVSLCHETGVQVMYSLQRHYLNDDTRGRRKIPTHLQELDLNV